MKRIIVLLMMVVMLIVPVLSFGAEAEINFGTQSSQITSRAYSEVKISGIEAVIGRWTEMDAGGRLFTVAAVVGVVACGTGIVSMIMRDNGGVPLETRTIAGKVARGAMTTAYGIVLMGFAIPIGALVSSTLK